MSFLSNEAKHRLSKLQKFLPKLVPGDDVILKTRLVVAGMIHSGSGMLESRVVHKPHSTKNSLECKKIPPKFGYNFDLILEGHKLLGIQFISNCCSTNCALFSIMQI